MTFVAGFMSGFAVAAIASIAAAVFFVRAVTNPKRGRR